jgi:hypothetical protein
MKDMKLQPEKKATETVEVKDEGHVPSMVTFKRFTRYFEWFRDKMVVKEESVKPVITESPAGAWSKVEPGAFYGEKEEFTINLFKRCKTGAVKQSDESVTVKLADKPVN